MHEHGLMRKLLSQASGEAAARGGELRGLRVRLGALTTSDEDHFRGDFEHVREEIGMPPLALEVEMAPDHPAGVELLSIEVGRGRAREMKSE